LKVLIDEAIRVLRRHFFVLFPAIALPLAFLSVPLSFIYFKRVTSIASFTSGTPPALSEVLALMGGVGAAFAGIMAIHYAAWGACILGTMNAASGRPIDMTKSWLWLLNPRVIGTILLTMLCVFAGSLLCLLPGIYLTFLFSFVAPVMAEERRFGVAALKRSAELLHFDRRLRLGDNPIVKAFVLAMVAWMLASALSMVFQVPFALVQQILMIRKASGGEAPDPVAMMEEMAWFQIPGAALGSMTNAALYLYVNLGLALLFLDARRRREGEDLDAMLRELERSVSEPQAS
jgi:hypothetical protein